MNKLIIFNEPVKIGSQIATNDSFTNWNDPIAAVLESLTDSNEPFRASLQWTETHK